MGIYELGQLEERLGNIELARRNYKKANKFNNNWLSFYGLIELERRLGNIKEAKSEYDQFKKRVRDNPDIQKHSDQYRIYLLGMCAMKLDDDPVARKIFHYLRDIPEFEKISIFGLMTLETKSRNYEKAYHWYLQLKNTNGNKDDLISLFILYKLDLLSIDHITNHNYHKIQLLEYNKELAIAHIIKHKAEFLQHVDLAVMFHLCSRNIENLTPTTRTGESDIYFLDFTSNIAKVNNKPTNRVAIITIADTKNILTLFPEMTENIVNTYHDVFNDQKQDHPKIKRKSQIEKFNSRYHL